MSTTVNLRAWIILIVIAAAFLTDCKTLNRARTDNRDFAVDTFQPGPVQIEAAEQRAKRYWAKHSGVYEPEPHLLAVVCGLVDASDLGVPFSAKVDHSETTASYFNHGIYSDLQTVTGIMIYNTKTNQLMGKQGYIFVDTPPIGTVVHVQNLSARYIGRGD